MAYDFDSNLSPRSVTGTIILALVILSSSALVLKLYRLGQRENDLPPGPPTLPLIGNLHLLPKTGLHFQFVKWAQQYGSVFSLKLGPGTMIVLNDRDAVRALLDGKSSIYSSRPDLHVVHDLITRGNHLLPMKYGTKWRRVRKIMVRSFREDLCDSQYLPVVEAEAVQMMMDFFERPNDFMRLPKRFSNSVIMSIVFGTRTPTLDAKHLVDFYAMMDRWAEVGETGATPPVDILPVFKYLPESIWRQWKTRAQKVGKAMQSLYGGWGNQARARRERGEILDSIIDSLLDDNVTNRQDDDELNLTCAVMVEASTDTSASMILAAINALTKYPEVQTKAHAELDRKLPKGRSPRWDDYDELPYIACVVKETMRWRPTAPIAFPHANTQDDTYKGMFIPKNSTIVLNSWGLHNDAGTFVDPDAFNPDRYSNQTRPASEYINSTDPAERDHYGYGAGRRSCPGIHLAERMLFVGIAKLIWAFTFDPKVDPDTGKPMDINVDFETGYNHGFVYCVKDFPAEIKIRDAGKQAIIQKELEEAKTEIFSQFKVSESYS